MNILHMRYVVEVARLGSINKAADELFMAQSNLSRCIKEMEIDLGIEIFCRSAKGMMLTPEGEDFVSYAQKILNELDGIENLFKKQLPKQQRFSVSVPRASYISDAFVQFSKTLNDNPAEIYYMETNSSNAIGNILSSDYHLGIIRYAANYDRYFKEMLNEKGLSFEIVAEFKYVLIMSRESPIAEKENLKREDLSGLIEIIHGDPYIPSLPVAEVKKAVLDDNIERRIFLYERGSQFDLLSENPNTFMWVSPVPEKTLSRYGLVQRACIDNNESYKDVLIRRKNYVLSDLDKEFITFLCDSRRKYLQG